MPALPRHLYFYLQLGLRTVAHGAVAVDASLRGDWVGVERQQRAWGAALARAAGLRLHVDGAHLAVPGRPYVIIANHVTALDPPVLFAALPMGTTYVAKRELLDVPFFGPLIGHTGAVFIDRGDSLRSRQALHAAVARVHAGQSVLVFAEGTRTRSGRLKPFKKGGFVLAIGAQVDVLPVALGGLYEKLKPGELLPRPGEVTIRLCAPISTVGMGYEDRARLMAQTRAVIAEATGQELEGAARRTPAAAAQ